MGQAVSEVLPFAIGVGISPIPIIAVILMLFSQRAKVNGPVFLVGWVLGLSVVVTVVYAIANAATHDGSSPDSVSWFKIVVGVLLLVVAGRNWAKRPKPGEEPQLPRWMAGVDHIQPAKAFRLALVLSALNPKNLALAAGAAAGVAQLGASTGDAVVALAVFVVLGSASVALAVVYDLVGGARARATLDDMKQWLTLHNSAVMAVLFLVFGVLLISQGVGLISR